MVGPMRIERMLIAYKATLLPLKYEPMAASLGFEPRHADSKSTVLPLHYEARTHGYHR